MNVVAVAVVVTVAVAVVLVAVVAVVVVVVVAVAVAVAEEAAAAAVVEAAAVVVVSQESQWLSSQLLVLPLLFLLARARPAADATAPSFADAPPVDGRNPPKKRCGCQQVFLEGFWPTVTH